MCVSVNGCRNGNLQTSFSMLINILLYTTNALQCKHSIKLSELNERPNSGIYGLGTVLNTLYLCPLFSLSDNEMFLFASRTLVAPSSIVEEPIMSERLSRGFHLDIQSVKQAGSESKHKNINGLVRNVFLLFSFFSFCRNLDPYCGYLNVHSLS